MSYDGNGAYSLPAPEYPAIPGTTILAEDYNTILADLAAALSLVLVRDGQSAMTGDLNMGDNDITGVQSLTAKIAGMIVNGDISFNALGSVVFNGPVAANAAMSALTKAPGTNTTDVATCAFVLAQAFLSALPGISVATAGMYVTNDGATASWAAIIPPQVIRTTRSADAVLAIADKQKLVEVTANSFTQTFDLAVTLGSGWFVYYYNNGTGDVTLDPSGAELIDGLSSYVMYPGECRLIQCDGVGFNSIILKGFSKAFTASGTFTKPPGYKDFSGELWNGGNSGTKSSAGAFARGGAGGGCFPFTLPASLFAASESVVVGAGGAAVSTTTAGLVGGVSSIGSVITMTVSATNEIGSSIIGATVASASATAVGFEAGSNSATPGRTLYGGAAPCSTGAAQSGRSLFGGAAGASIGSDNVVGTAGTSTFGGNGGAASNAAPGTAGAAPGGGGGATQTGATSGAGARGEVRIRGVV